MKELIEQYNNGQVDADDIAWEATKQGYRLSPYEHSTLFYKGDQLAFIMINGKIEINGGAL